MMKSSYLKFTVLASLSLVPFVPMGDAEAIPVPEAALAPAPVPGLGPNLVVQLKGSAVGQMRKIDTNGDGKTDTTANCFEVDMFDPSTGRKIGKAIDCLSSISNVGNDVGTGLPNLKLTGTTFFQLPGGTLVTQGLTTVRPALHPTKRGGVTFTHVTGANGDGGVQYGTRMFRNVRGLVRLSGMVDLSQLSAKGQITFDCLFVVRPSR